MATGSPNLESQLLPGRTEAPKILIFTADLGATVLPGSPAEFGKLIAHDTEKWGKVVKFAGIKAE